jgi:SAM-dependent methyltransferase
VPVKVGKDKHKRTFEQLQNQYEAEKKLATRLLNSEKQERKHLYNSLYEELYQKIPYAPELKHKNNPDDIAWILNQRMQLLGKFLKPEITFLEVGPGDCSLSIEVAKHVKKVYAVDVSNEIVKSSFVLPDNFEVTISDGCSIDVPPGTVDLAYSHQLMEHLHPDDANEQLQNICKALAPGGLYICITPNRLSGPHDTSQFFENTASGYHLKEYTVTEMYRLFKDAGFSEVLLYKSYKTQDIKLPLSTVTIGLFKLIEGVLNVLPFELKRGIAGLPLLFRGMTIVGVK